MKRMFLPIDLLLALSGVLALVSGGNDQGQKNDNDWAFAALLDLSQARA
jgi:hypothetical protein